MYSYIYVYIRFCVDLRYVFFSFFFFFEVNYLFFSAIEAPNGFIVGKLDNLPDLVGKVFGRISGEQRPHILPGR